MAFDAGSLMLRIEARDQQFMSQMDRIEDKLQSGHKSMDKMEKGTRDGFKAMGRAAALFGVAVSKAWDMATFGLSSLLYYIKAAGIASIGLASDAGEIGSKFDTVFGSAAPRAKAEIDAFGKSVGRGKNELYTMMGTLQDTFVPLGFAREKAADLAIGVTKLATDLASFNNSSDTEAMEALQSALIGNHETVRKYGVIITEATLNQQLMTMGVKGGTEAASEQQKALARLQMIMAGTSDAQGDATKTAGSFANQSKALWAAVSDLGGEFGNLLLPTLQVFIGATKDSITWVQGHMVELRSWGATFAEWAQFGVDAFQEVIGFVSNFDLYWEHMQITTAQIMMGMFDRVSWFADNAWTAIKWFFTNFWDIATTTAQNYMQLWQNVGKNMGKIWQGIWKIIKSGGKEGMVEVAALMVEGMKEFNSSPEFKEFKGTSFDEEWKQHAAKWEERLKGMEKTAGKTGETANKALDLQSMFDDLEGGKKKKGEKNAEISGIEDIFKKTLMKRFEDTDAQKSLKVQEASKVAVETLVKNQEEQHKELVAAVKGSTGAAP